MVVYKVDRWCKTTAKKGTVIEELDKQYRITDETGKVARWAKNLCYTDPAKAAISLIENAQKIVDAKKAIYDESLKNLETAKAWVVKETGDAITKT